MRLRGSLVVAAFTMLAGLGGAGWWQLRTENKEMERRLFREDAMRAAREGRHVEAAKALGEVARQSPQDVEAAYMGAREADAAGDYNAAREGYLKTLALEPHHGDARARLVELTERAGARDEARHHLSRLEEQLGASDPRVIVLRQRLGTEGGPL